VSALIVPVRTSDLDNRSFLVLDEGTHRGVIVDPSFDTAPLRQAMADHGLEPEAILLTHGHIDHIAGIPGLGVDLPIWIHAADAPMLSDGMLNGGLLFGVDWKPIEPARLLSEGDEIELGELSLRILHTPGHTPGSVTVDVGDGAALLVGDLIFCGSVGRTDLPGGDQEQLIASIRRVCDGYDDPPIHCGHGESSTLGVERRGNPYLQMWLSA
jgi:glyoxylase-like metal-dependent hydrolase (beta-lactamase superfamily II)